jgi:choline kinase
LRPPPLRERLARQANEGDDAAELVKLAGAGTMRIIDVLTLVKHEDGSVHPSWPTSRSFPGSRLGRRPGGSALTSWFRSGVPPMPQSPLSPSHALRADPTRGPCPTAVSEDPFWALHLQIEWGALARADVLADCHLTLGWKSRQSKVLSRVMAVTAVIVAAGRGIRLRAPCKPLVVVGGVTLLDRALATARAAGIDRRLVVVASLHGPVASFCRRQHPDVEVVPAPDHVRGNGATVVSGLAHAGGRCLVMMVDHLHEVATLRRMLEADGEFVLAVDSRAAYVDPEDATLARRENGRVTAIGKQLPRFDAIEAGLAACSAEPAGGVRLDARRRARVRPPQARVARGGPPDPRGGDRGRVLD